MANSLIDNMDKYLSLSDLDDFARECINSKAYPDDIHNFSTYTCSSCKVSTSFRLLVEHHTGSVESNFRGIIWGECSECGYLMRLFTYTGTHRQMLIEEQVVCECGNRSFLAGLCERTESEKGIPGFFDEGVVVGKCTQCNLNSVIVYID
jgi:hypothetical protein